jgi:hypothetical protein
MATAMFYGRQKHQFVLSFEPYKLFLLSVGIVTSFMSVERLVATDIRVLPSTYT